MNTYVVRYDAQYTLRVEAESQEEAHRIAEETELDRWARYGSEYDVRDISQLPPDIPDHVRKSLTLVIDHLWAEELKRHEVLCELEPDSYLEQRLFVHLAEIKAWLKPCNFRPTWCADDD